MQKRGDFFLVYKKITLILLFLNFTIENIHTNIRWVILTRLAHKFDDNIIQLREFSREKLSIPLIPLLVCHFVSELCAANARFSQRTMDDIAQCLL